MGEVVDPNRLRGGGGDNSLRGGLVVAQYLIVVIKRLINVLFVQFIFAMNI
jgi:hypothetical protein